jgi:hypothetical protein
MKLVSVTSLEQSSALIRLFPQDQQTGSNLKQALLFFLIYFCFVIADSRPTYPDKRFKIFP